MKKKSTILSLILISLYICLGDCEMIARVRTLTASDRGSIHNSQNSKSIKTGPPNVVYNRVERAMRSLNIDSDTIFNFIANGRGYVIFDCKTPSFIDSNYNKVILKKHIINDNIKRLQENTSYEMTFICNKNDQLWRSNPKLKKLTQGIIAFSEVDSSNTDGNIIFYDDEQSIRNYFRQLESSLKVRVSQNDPSEDVVYYLKNQKIFANGFEVLIRDILTLCHYPKYVQIRNEKPLTIDVVEEAKKSIPQAVREIRAQEAQKLYEIFTREEKNLTVVKKEELKEQYIGDGLSYIVFNCTHPKIIEMSTNKVQIVDLQGNDFNFITSGRVSSCDPKENVWRHKNDTKYKNAKKYKNPEKYKNAYYTFDVATHGQGPSPSIAFIEVLKEKNICHNFLEFFHHPYYFDKSFEAPIECGQKKPTSNSNKQYFR